MASTVERLNALSETVESVHGYSSTARSSDRAPDFAAPSHGSTRPKSSRGTTFHFSHKSISKKRDISEGNSAQTPSSAHQGYIERPSASEAMTEAEQSLVLAQPLAGPVDDTPPERVGKAPGLRSEDSFQRSGRVTSRRHIGFGTLGDAPRERRDFWLSVEGNERRNARVQNRIIAELPHELSRHDRLRAALDFCQVFEERDLPYWAAIHTPTGSNDRRNHHLHIAYSDRPARRSDDGEWDFTITELHRKPSRNTVKKRPYMRAKNREARSRGWIKTLRRVYADTCNYYLSMSGQTRRLDPRSYAESGVDKEPTEHVGSKASALESRGLDTQAGSRNAKREIRWRFARAERPWLRRVAPILERMESRTGDAKDTPQAPSQDDEILLGIARDGIGYARRAVANRVSADLLERRLHQRIAYLAGQKQTQTGRDFIELTTDAIDRSVRHASELDLLQRQREDISRTADKCRKNALRAERQDSDAQRRFDKAAARQKEDPFDMNTHGAPIEDGMSEPLDQDDTRVIRDALDDIVPDENTRKKHPAGTRTKGAAQDDPFEEMQRRDLTGAATLASLSGDHHHEQDDDDLHPDALLLDRPETDDDLQAIDDRLREMDNTTLRSTAIATRDALDLDADARTRPRLARGHAVLDLEARRRGLDLDTGVQSPERAEDPERAKLHTDQAACHIRVIRKNLDRQRVRG